MWYRIVYTQYNYYRLGNGEIFDHKANMFDYKEYELVNIVNILLATYSLYNVAIIVHKFYSRLLESVHKELYIRCIYLINYISNNWGINLNIVDIDHFWPYDSHSKLYNYWFSRKDHNLEWLHCKVYIPCCLTYNVLHIECKHWHYKDNN